MKFAHSLACIALFALSATAVAAPSAPAASAPATTTRVAMLNMQEAIKSVKEGKKAEETLRKEWEDRQKKLQADGKKIQDSMEDLRKQASIMDEKTRREKEEAIQGQIMRLREQEAKSQADFQKRDQDISKPIIEKLRTIVAQVSKEKGYTLVIDGGNVIYAQDQDDITDEVIKRYDAKK
ncbi:MAG: OmpH family outer membrane protein [Bacteriovoracia bacterium]